MQKMLEMLLWSELGSSLREGNGNPLQYSFLGNPMDRRAWWATVHGVTKLGQDWAHTHSTHTPDNTCYPNCLFTCLRFTHPIQGQSGSKFYKSSKEEPVYFSGNICCKYNLYPINTSRAFPDDASGKEPAWQCRKHKRCGFIHSLGWEDSPEGENRNPLQYSCLGNHMGRGTWRATIHGAARNLAQLK